MNTDEYFVSEAELEVSAKNLRKKWTAAQLQLKEDLIDTVMDIVDKKNEKLIAFVGSLSDQINEKNTIIETLEKSLTKASTQYAQMVDKRNKKTQNTSNNDDFNKECEQLRAQLLDGQQHVSQLEKKILELERSLTDERAKNERLECKVTDKQLEFDVTLQTIQSNFSQALIAFTEKTNQTQSLTLQQKLEEQKIKHEKEVLDLMTTNYEQRKQRDQKIEELKLENERLREQCSKPETQVPKVLPQRENNVCSVSVAPNKRKFAAVDETVLFKPNKKSRVKHQVSLYDLVNAKLLYDGQKVCCFANPMCCGTFKVNGTNCTFIDDADKRVYSNPSSWVCSPEVLEANNKSDTAQYSGWEHVYAWDQDEQKWKRLSQLRKLLQK